jgi:hypothetical protein
VRCAPHVDVAYLRVGDGPGYREVLQVACSTRVPRFRPVDQPRTLSRSIERRESFLVSVVRARVQEVLRWLGRMCRPDVDTGRAVLRRRQRPHTARPTMVAAAGALGEQKSLGASRRGTVLVCWSTVPFFVVCLSLNVPESKVWW